MFEEGGHLTINAGARLRIWQGGIVNNDCENVSYLTFNSELSDPDDAWASVFGEFLLHPNVTVNNHPKAIVKTVTKTGYYMDEGKKVWRWHRFSLLVSELISWTKNPNVGAILNIWDYQNNAWKQVSSFSEITPFIGINITSNQTINNFLFTIENNILGNDNLIFNFYRDGLHAFGNSHMAKIDITKFLNDLPPNIYNEGVGFYPNPEGKIVEKSYGKILPGEQFVSKNNTTQPTTINLSYKDLCWDPSFEEDVTPTRGLMKGTLTTAKPSEIDTTLEGSAIFDNPEPIFPPEHDER